MGNRLTFLYSFLVGTEGRRRHEVAKTGFWRKWARCGETEEKLFLS